MYLNVYLRVYLLERTLVVYLGPVLLCNWCVLRHPRVQHGHAHVLEHVLARTWHVFNKYMLLSTACIQPEYMLNTR